MTHIGQHAEQTIGPCRANPDSVAEIALVTQEKLLAELREVVSAVGEVLAPVMVPDVPDIGPVAEVPEPGSSAPLVAEIEHNNVEIGRLTNQLANYRSRVAT